MAKTKYPFFANMLVDSYCDDTEPKLYPHAFTEYVPKTELDEAKEIIPELIEALDLVLYGNPSHLKIIEMEDLLKKARAL